LGECLNSEIGLRPPPWPIGSYVLSFIKEAVLRRKDGLVNEYLREEQLGLGLEYDDMVTCYRRLKAERERLDLQKKLEQ
jgi:hypothetical protein